MPVVLHQLCNDRVAVTRLCQQQQNVHFYLILSFVLVGKFCRNQYSYANDMFFRSVYWWGNARIHLFFNKCFHFKYSWGSWYVKSSFLVLSSNGQAGAIWLILEHEFTSESFHELSDTRPLLWNISFDMQSLPRSSTLTWALSLIQQSSASFHALYMAVNLLHSQLTCKIKHISFHSYFISWIAFLFLLCWRDNARDLWDMICRNQCSCGALLSVKLIAGVMRTYYYRCTTQNSELRQLLYSLWTWWSGPYYEVCSELQSNKDEEGGYAVNMHHNVFKF